MSSPSKKDERPPHSHHHHSHGIIHSAEIVGVSDSRLLWAVIFNQLLTVGQVIAGIFSGSIALLSDAAHNFNDANSLLIAYITRKISRKAANERFTFGYRRAELIGAMINLTLLFVIGLYLVWEGIHRLLEPAPIIGSIMAITAVVALIIDVATAVMLWSMSSGSLNVRAAFIHNLTDALGSVAVLIGAACVIWFDWTWVDPAISFLIAGYVLWQMWCMFPEVIRILMAGTPPDIDLQQLQQSVESIDGVEGMHHLHVWQLDERHRALEAHIQIGSQKLEQMTSLKQKIKQLLLEQFNCQHTTLEFEFTSHEEEKCDDSELIVEH